MPSTVAASTCRTAEVAISDFLQTGSGLALGASGSSGRSWPLVWLIRGYRRWLSGRGPLRRVRCSFEHTESCSAYGLRVAEQAPSAGAALTLIRGRLKRCGSLRLHFEQDLIWGAGYDEKSPAEIVEWAAAQAELPVTQAAIERAARVVSQERWNTGATLQRALGTPRVLLRGGDGSRGQRAMLFTLLRLWLPLLFGLALLCVWSAWLAPLLAVATALCAAQLLSARRKLHDWRERVATLRAAREFEVF